MELAGIITGSIALIVSVIVSFIVAWKTHLSPFRLKLYCSSPRLEPRQFDLDNGKKVTRFAATLPLHFVNTGARDGAIEDVMLKVHSDKYTWLFQPFYFTEFDLVTASTFFHTIHLPGKGEIYKPIAFAPIFKKEEFPQYPRGDDPLSPGMYYFEIHVLYVRGGEYERKPTTSYDIGAETIQSLESGDWCIPFSQEVKGKRKSL